MDGVSVYRHVHVGLDGVVGAAGTEGAEGEEHQGWKGEMHSESLG